MVASSAAATGLEPTSPAPTPASASVHHCSLISPANGSRTISRTRAISTLKA
jgi:hypothetical protein